MISRMGKVEIRQIDSLRRAQLIDILLAFKECPQISFSQPWLEEQPTDKLRLLLLAARLYRALKATAARATPSPETA
jgi:hypothetical protein